MSVTEILTDLVLGSPNQLEIKEQENRRLRSKLFAQMLYDTVEKEFS